MPTVNAENLVWAREHAGLTREQAAESLGFKDNKKTKAIERLEALEEGEVYPSRSILSKMADLYRRPLIFFYAKDPPPIADRGSDFRTLHDSVNPKMNADVDALLRNVQVRQSIARSALEDEDASPISFIESLRTSHSLNYAAEIIQRAINFSLAEFRSAQKPAEAFSYLRKQVEKSGVFVLLLSNLGSHHTDIDVNIFRGFALADPIAPFIVINDKDAKGALSFTLLHELTHLFLGTTGVSGGYPDTKIEKFCNNVAGQMLFPDTELSDIKMDTALDFKAIKEIIQDLADKKNISCSMVAYRLMSSEIIPFKLWQELHNSFRADWVKARAQKKSEQKDDSGPNYYTIKRYQIGNSLFELMRRGTSGGLLSPSKVSKVLGVKPRSVIPFLSYSPSRKSTGEVLA